MKKSLRCILNIFLIASLLIASVVTCNAKQQSEADEYTEKTNDNYSYTGVVSDTRGRYVLNVEYMLDPSWFFESNEVFNSSLNKTSALFSIAAYRNLNNYLSAKQGDNLIVDRDVEFNEYISRMGFADSRYVETKSIYNDIHNARFYAAYKKINYNGTAKNLIVINIRGTDSSYEEWLSNFDFAGEDNSVTGDYWRNNNNHKGFDIAANKIMDYMVDYVKSNNLDSSDNVYWIMGHSRGAGIANVLGANYEKMQATAFTYTFASPRTTIDKDYASIKTVFNTVNEEDFVAYMPGDASGYERYGTTIKKSGFDYAELNNNKLMNNYSNEEYSYMNKSERDSLINFRKSIDGMFLNSTGDVRVDAYSYEVDDRYMLLSFQSQEAYNFVYTNSSASMKAYFDTLTMITAEDGTIKVYGSLSNYFPLIAGMSSGQINPIALLMIQGEGVAKSFTSSMTSILQGFSKAHLATTYYIIADQIDIETSSLKNKISDDKSEEIVEDKAEEKEDFIVEKNDNKNVIMIILIMIVIAIMFIGLLIFIKKKKYKIHKK